jgi:epsilon-lactone hydrolase
MAYSDELAKNQSEVASVRAMVGQMFAADGGSPSLADMRAGYDAWGLAFPLPEGGTCEAITLGGVPTDRIVLPDSDHTQALLYFHGGGYGIGSAKSHRHLVGQLCNASGFVGYNVDYRLAPEVAFPGAVDDALAAYRGLLEQGIAPRNIIIAGDSAGGGLTLACALAIKAAGLPQPAGLFPISPWANLTQTGSSYELKADLDFICNKPDLQNWADLYLAGGDATNPLVSPVYGDFTGIATMLIHVGSAEVLLSDALKIAEVAGLADVSVELFIAPDMPHVFHYMWAQLTLGRSAIVDAGAWMKARVS